MAVKSRPFVPGDRIKLTGKFLRNTGQMVGGGADRRAETPAEAPIGGVAVTRRTRTRPSVTLQCPADQYARPNERIIEFFFKSGAGGLISFRDQADGTQVVDIYRTDPTVTVRTGTK